MKWLQSVLNELVGLFIDDGRFALAILLWVSLVGLLLPRLPLATTWYAPVLLIGLLAILLESVWRRAMSGRLACMAPNGS